MPMLSNEARRNLLSNERLDTFWDALWLELWPFLCFTVEISSNRMPMLSNEARRSWLSNEHLDTFWDALWLELWPFLYFRCRIS